MKYCVCCLSHDTLVWVCAGSDSEVYDTEGRFVPEKFEELFTKYDRRNRKGLDFNEMWELSEANRNIIDPTGWTAEKLEWWATWFIAGDKNVSALAPGLCSFPVNSRQAKTSC